MPGSTRSPAEVPESIPSERYRRVSSASTQTTLHNLRCLHPKRIMYKYDNFAAVIDTFRVSAFHVSPSFLAEKVVGRLQILSSSTLILPLGMPRIFKASALQHFGGRGVQIELPERMKAPFSKFHQFEPWRGSFDVLVPGNDSCPRPVEECRLRRVFVSYEVEKRHCIVVTSTPMYECTAEKLYQRLSHSKEISFKSALEINFFRHGIKSES